MRYIAPALIGDTQLIASNVAEADYPAWVGATAYAVGDRVLRTTTHRLYERLIAGTTATAPESDAVNWAEVSASNRWKMFDQSSGSQTANATTIAVTLAPGVIDSLALLDFNAGSVHVVMLDAPGGATVYDQTFVIGETTGTVDDWFDYFFTVPRRRTSLVVEGLPLYANGHLTVTLSDPNARCGTLVVGQTVVIGESLRGAAVGIIDYSKKITNPYTGANGIVERGYSKTIDVPVLINNNDLDYLTDRLAEVRATPCVWIASSRNSALIVFGWCRDWRINITYATHSEARIAIEGLA